jgi:MFS family permease
MSGASIAGGQMTARSSLRREVALTTGLALAFSTLFVWFGPPGTDMAAHIYQKLLFMRHGLVLWDNRWYAGRYSFITYSPLYYPLATLLGIRVLAILSLSVASGAYTAIVYQEWGDRARWSGRAFALFWAGFALSAAFPFALGLAFAMLALRAVQLGRRWSFAILCALTLAASVLAFAFLVVVLVGIALARRRELRRSLALAATGTILGLAFVEAVLMALFPDSGRFPFPKSEYAAAAVFCLLGFVVTFRNERTRLLAGFFGFYLAACTVAFAWPSPLGENIARLRFTAAPIAVLALSLRQWRPRLLSIGVLSLALAWNLTPLVSGFHRGTSDPSRNASFWAPPIRFLHDHLTPAYRVEAVDTAGHWEALYLPQAGIPLTRGWFRQDDFPENDILYTRMTLNSYLQWLRMLSVRYVVLSNGPLDYSARREAEILRTHPDVFKTVYWFPGGEVMTVPSPLPLVRGPASAKVLGVGDSTVVFTVAQRGQYVLGVRYSPYFTSKDACISEAANGLTIVSAKRSGRVKVGFAVRPGVAARALFGRTPGCDPAPRPHPLP